MSKKKQEKKQAIWWARMNVTWEDEANQEQVVFLPERQAREALQWFQVMGCSTWAQVAEVAPELEDDLREHAEELDWQGDEFRFEDIPAFQDGDLPPSPNSLMERALPREFVAAFGGLGDTVLSGPSASFPAAHLTDALTWLEQHGYTVEEHPELADLGRDPSEFLPR